MIPGLLIAFVGLHLLMVLKLGINEWPMPGRVVKRSTYDSGIPRDTKQRRHTVCAGRDLEGFVLCRLHPLRLLACAAYFGPFGPGGQPDPTIVQTAPKPDYFFLWLYALLAFLPPSMETPALLIGPRGHHRFLDSAAILLRRRRKALVAPSDRRAHDSADRRRPRHFHRTWPVHTVESDHERVERRSCSGSSTCMARPPLERQGAVVFQEKQCRNCHAIGGTGGMRGPALDSVAVRKTHAQLVRQVVQGGGNMPAYGKNLNPAEVDALVSFLDTLHPANQPGARDSARQISAETEHFATGTSSGEKK